MPLPVILLDDSGEFGNRVITHCLLLAACASRKLPFVNLCMWRYEHFFAHSTLWTSSVENPTPLKERTPRPHETEACWKCRIPFLARIHRKFVFDGFEVSKIGSLSIRLARWIAKSFLFGLAAKSFYTKRDFKLDGHRFHVLIPASNNA